MITFQMTSQNRGHKQRINSEDQRRFFLQKTTDLVLVMHQPIERCVKGCDLNEIVVKTSFEVIDFLTSAFFVV